MVAEMSSQGAKSSQAFQVENNGDSRVALQLELFKRTADSDGVEKRVATSDLVVFPQQLTLDAGVKRTIKVSWVAAGAVEAEQPYRLVVTQLPVNFKKDKPISPQAGVNLSFLLQYVASIYVAPAQVRHNVVVASAERLGGGSIRITLKNEGTAHQLLRGMRLWIGPEKAEIKEEQLKILEADNLLPGEFRKFVVTPLLPLPVGTLSGVVEFPSS